MIATVPHSFGVRLREFNQNHEPAGSSKGGEFATAKSEEYNPTPPGPWVRINGGDWNTSAEGEDPFGWHRPTDDDYTVPEIVHKMVRNIDHGAWGSSHGTSINITGAAAAMMGIESYTDFAKSPEVKKIATGFLTQIAADTTGSEEILNHSFMNIRGTQFKVGDTLRLPVTATSGDVGSYGTRLEMENQEGEPVVFEFEKGTQMMGYATMTHHSAVEDLGYKGPNAVHDALKEKGYVWDEAIVAGGFKVVSVRDNVYFGSQHMMRATTKIPQLYGKVVRLRQTETFDPKKGWRPRG